MTVLSDKDIEKLCVGVPNPVISPFEPEMIRTDPTTYARRVVSYGLSSYGYDIRLAEEFEVFTNVTGAIIDPKNFNSDSLLSKKSQSVVIPPNSFVLGRSLEYIHMTRNLMALCLGKSTYARCGISINVTPLEPGWEGHITIEIANQSPCPARVYANEGIGQLIFLEGKSMCRTSYADRKGKYQGQKGVTLPTV